MMQMSLYLRRLCIWLKVSVETSVVVQCDDLVQADAVCTYVFMVLDFTISFD